MKTLATDHDLLKKVKECVRGGRYVLAKHAIVRGKERAIRLPSVLYVLENGRREQEKDSFDVKTQKWRHAIRGKTVDGDTLRVIVCFEEKMVIVTLIKVK